MRTESDSMGDVKVPEEALYGACTQRAVQNFHISDLRLQESFISALGIIKLAAARTNLKLELLNDNTASAICKAAEEVIAGTLNQHFVVDIFQTGSGTSTNMNANEVIANRALEITGSEKGNKTLIHPNDHVNMSQSSNDVIPSAMHIATALSLKNDLLPALKDLQENLSHKASEFSKVIKAGRTHLQDATPVTLGQEFSGYASQIELCRERLTDSLKRLYSLALGGTATGSGINAPDEFAKLAIKEISGLTGLEVKETDNHFAAQSSCDTIVETSGQLKVLACSLMKISNDLRWLSSGPRCGLQEIELPAVQPGSSIMPGKINPVICESAMMAAAQIIGNDSTVTVAGQHGNFELNTMLPVMAYNVLQSIGIASRSCNNLGTLCISGIKANADKCRQNAENTSALCTALAPVIGYDKATQIAKSSIREGISIRDAALKMKIMDPEQLDKILDPVELAGAK